MVFPGNIQINQCAKMFYVCLLVEGDKLISVIIRYLEDDFTIKFLLIKMNDYKVQLFSILKLAYW